MSSLSAEGPRYGTNSIDMEDLVAGTIVYGFGFAPSDTEFQRPSHLVSTVTFERMRAQHPPSGRNPLTRRPFQYLRSVPPPTDTQSGYITYRLSGDKETIQEIQEPINASTSADANAASAAASAAATAAAHNIVIGRPIPTATLAHSVRGASYGSIASSLLTGRPIETVAIRELLDYMRRVEMRLHDEREKYALMGHGHGSMNITRYETSVDLISDLEAELAYLDERLADMYADQHAAYHADGGRLGILAACFGQNNRTFLESRIRTLTREMDEIFGQHYATTHNTESLPNRYNQLRDQRQILLRELETLPRDEEGGCTISRKSRRRRNTRRRRSRANRRR
jgi:hypothetical protein